MSWRPKPSIRSRLTLLYASMFFLGGAVLVFASFLLVRHTLTEARNQLDDSPLLRVTGKVLGPERVLRDANGQLITFEEFRTQLAAEQRQVQDDALQELVLQSFAAAGVVGVLAAGVGWWMAGRSLRPLHRITDTARRIAERSLGERIRLPGPQDELKELADTFDAMLERLDRAFDGQRRFVANASHELRTPLTVSRTLLQVALARPGASDDLRELAQTLLEVNTQQRDLTDGLLALARSEISLDEFTDVDLAEIGSQVTDAVHAEARAAEVAVHADYGEATLRGDRVLLQLLLRNLVLNGIRHNHTGGWVRIETSCRHYEARLTVSNTGPVVSGEELHVIFEPFRRVGDERTGKGWGLGLSIVRSITAAHGGIVAAWPRTGGGLVVDVTLPRQPAPGAGERFAGPAAADRAMAGSTSAGSLPDLRTTPPPATRTAG